MKFAFTLFLIISFWAMSVFGFWSMPLEGSHGHGACIASLVQGSLCPETGGAFAFLNFHANAFKTFSSAVFEPLSLASVSITLLLLVVLLNFLIGPAPDLSLAVFRPYFGRHTQKPSLSVAPTLIDWWALHEKRDPDAPTAF